MSQTTVCRTSGYRQRYLCDTPTAAKNSREDVREDLNGNDDVSGFHQRDNSNGGGDESQDDDNDDNDDEDERSREDDDDDFGQQRAGDDDDDSSSSSSSNHRHSDDDDDRRDRSLQQTQQQQQQQHLRHGFEWRVLASRTQRRSQTTVFRSCASPAVDEQRAVMRFEVSECIRVWV
jgi:hypothetical protein